MGRITIGLVLIQFTIMCYGGIYTAGDMRLKTDSHRPNEGKVEIFYNDLWGSCDSYGIDEKTASVICRLLDLGIKGIAVDRYFTIEATPRVFSSLYCNGDETNILDCRFNVSTSINNYTYAAGVICADFNSSMLRLEGSVDDVSEGRLQFLYDSRWMGLCEDRINSETYHLACRQMGYEMVEEFKDYDVEAIDDTEILPFDEYSCVTYFTNPDQCFTTVFSYENCSRYGRIKIKCGFAPRFTFVRLVGGADPSEGRVELYDGEWRTVCSLRFTASAVDTVCKHAGWKTALSSGFNPGDGTLGIIPYLFYCNTYESFIGNCTIINRIYSCPHTYVVSVKCSDFRITDTRLVNGTGPQEGRLEIRVDDNWMTVCDETFLAAYSENGLDTVCRSLGYRGALDVLPDAYFGEGSGGVVTHYFSCPTYALSLDNCTVGYYEGSWCKNHWNDVSVICGDLEIEDIRLVDGTGVNEGRVEMFIDSKWRTVCDFEWSNEEADVLCRSMGFARAEEFYYDAHFGQGTGRVFSNVFDCSGMESHIQNCNITHTGRNCSHSDDFSVRCVACEELSIPTNGQITITGTLHGDVARFECEPGFMVTGSSLRVCLPNNTWNGTDTECVRDCGEISAPKNGSVIVPTNNLSQTTVTFSCEPGFELIGMTNITCLENGTWNGSYPTCEIKDCGAFEAPLNGSVVFSSGTVYASVATINCDQGFTLYGKQTRQCLQNGTWEGDIPVCLSNSMLVIDANSEETRNPVIAGEPEQGDILKEGLLYGGVCVALLTGIAVGICISVYYRRKMRKKNAANKTSTSNLPPLSNGQVPGGGPPVSHGQVPGGGTSLVNSSESYSSLRQSTTTTTNEGTVNYNSNGSVLLNPAPPLNLSSLLKTSDSYHSV